MFARVWRFCRRRAGCVRRALRAPEPSALHLEPNAVLKLKAARLVDPEVGMADFTAPQLNVLRTLVGFPILCAEGITKVLCDKGILTADEVKAAVQAVTAGRAGLMIDKAFGAELERLENEFRRQAEGMQPESH